MSTQGPPLDKLCGRTSAPPPTQRTTKSIDNIKWFTSVTIILFIMDEYVVYNDCAIYFFNKLMLI